MNLRSGDGFSVRSHLGHRHAGNPVLSLDIHHRMAQLQGDAEIIQALDNVALQTAGVGHQLCHQQYFGALQRHAPGHDQADVPGAQDDHPAARHVAFHIDQALGGAGGEDAGRPETRDIQSASRALPAAHGKDDGAGLEGKDAVGGVDGGYGPIRRDVQYHGVELVGDLPLFYLRDKAGGVLRPGQFFLEGVEPEAVVDALI